MCHALLCFVCSTCMDGQVPKVAGCIRSCMFSMFDSAGMDARQCWPQVHYSKSQVSPITLAEHTSALYINTLPGTPMNVRHWSGQSTSKVAEYWVCQHNRRLRGVSTPCCALAALPAVQCPKCCACSAVPQTGINSFLFMCRNCSCNQYGQILYRFFYAHNQFLFDLHCNEENRATFRGAMKAKDGAFAAEGWLLNLREFLCE